jgi:GT2 family glycosyltransferase
VKALQSAERGILVPDKYFIIDNGGRFERNDFYNSLGDRLEVVNYGQNLGVAGSWNKIIQCTSEIRIISNDDVEFFDDTIKLLVDYFVTDAVIYPAGIPAANSFSCYVIPDNVVEKVGYFDEKISPNYGYFEDNDYYRRMLMNGIHLIGIGNCRLGHSGSSTLNGFIGAEQRNHHLKFKTAEKNYVRKWGGVPGKETLTVPREL